MKTNLITTETLVEIPKKYLKKDFAWKKDPTIISEIKGNLAIWYSVTVSGSVLKVPLKELKITSLPYFSYHKDNLEICGSSQLSRGVEVHTAAFYALKAIGKYSDGGYIRCFFTDETLQKIRVKGKNGSKTFTVQELENYY